MTGIRIPNPIKSTKTVNSTTKSGLFENEFFIDNSGSLTEIGQEMKYLGVSKKEFQSRPQHISRRKVARGHELWFQPEMRRVSF